MRDAPFVIRGSGTGPVILSVPHAGRDYAPWVTRLRLPVSAARPLEDRWADRLAEAAIAAGTPALIAQVPRLVIDLNREESDLDPAMVAGPGSGHPVSARARSGLGLIPSRLSGCGTLWRGPLSPLDVAARLSGIYRPWHAALATLLQTARARHGTAILIDLHSMPPLDSGYDIVIGDRFGASADDRIAATAEAVLTGQGFRVTRNVPYAGGAIATRHGKPMFGVHALQIEIDRRLYLDADFDQPGPGLAFVQNAVAAIVSALRAECRPSYAVAAE
ncbi:MAG: N-formylglutamate amidohydrolase [Sphingomonadaceae bacterium]